MTHAAVSVQRPAPLQPRNRNSGSPAAGTCVGRSLFTQARQRQTNSVPDDMPAVCSVNSGVPPQTAIRRGRRMHACLHQDNTKITSLKVKHKEMLLVMIGVQCVKNLSSLLARSRTRRGILASCECVLKLCECLSKLAVRHVFEAAGGHQLSRKLC